MNRLYQIYDKKAETVIGSIISAKADAVAIRSFADTMKAEGTMLHDHPEDFDLLLLGTQEDSGQLCGTYSNSGMLQETVTIMQGLVMYQLLNAPKDA